MKDNLAVNTIETRTKIGNATTKEATNTSTEKDIAEKEVAKTRLLSKKKKEIEVMIQSAIESIAQKTTRRNITSIGDMTQTQMIVVLGQDQDHQLLKVLKIRLLSKRPKLQILMVLKRLKLRTLVKISISITN